MERIPGLTKGTQVEFNQVLMLSKDGQVAIGTPFVQGAKVVGEVLRDDVKGKKLVMVRFRRRKGVHVKKGHRQKYIDVKIKQIVAP